MSPDARLIALSILYAATDCYDIETASERLAAVEKDIAKMPKEPGIRGMVPVALVRDWLRDIHAKVLGAEEGREAIAVETIIRKYTQELAQFSGDA